MLKTVCLVCMCLVSMPIGTHSYSVTTATHVLPRIIVHFCFVHLSDCQQKCWQKVYKGFLNSFRALIIALIVIHLPWQWKFLAVLCALSVTSCSLSPFNLIGHCQYGQLLSQSLPSALLSLSLYTVSNNVGKKSYVGIVKTRNPHTRDATNTECMCDPWRGKRAVRSSQPPVQILRTYVFQMSIQTGEHGHWDVYLLFKDKHSIIFRDRSQIPGSKSAMSTTSTPTPLALYPSPRTVGGLSHSSGSGILIRTS